MKGRFWAGRGLGIDPWVLGARNEGVGPCTEMVFPPNGVADVIKLDVSLVETLGIFTNEGVPPRTRLSKSSAVVPARLGRGVWFGRMAALSAGPERNEGVGGGQAGPAPGPTRGEVESGGGDIETVLRAHTYEYQCRKSRKTEKDLHVSVALRIQNLFLVVVLIFGQNRVHGKVNWVVLGSCAYCGTVIVRMWELIVFFLGHLFGAV